MNGQGWWYVARGSGIVAWLLLAGAVAFGLIQAGDRTNRRSPAWHVDLHRGLSGLACWAVAAHLVALLADDFARLDLADLFVPLRVQTDSWGVAWGIIALYVTVAVEVTSLGIRRLSWRVWRRIHYAGLATFWLVTLHGLQAGTDATNWLVRTLGVLVLVTVGALSVARLRPPGRRPRHLKAEG